MFLFYSFTYKRTTVWPIANGFLMWVNHSWTQLPLSQQIFKILEAPGSKYIIWTLCKYTTIQFVPLIYQIIDFNNFSFVLQCLLFQWDFIFQINDTILKIVTRKKWEIYIKYLYPSPRSRNETLRSVKCTFGSTFLLSFNIYYLMFLDICFLPYSFGSLHCSLQWAGVHTHLAVVLTRVTGLS